MDLSSVFLDRIGMTNRTPPTNLASAGLGLASSGYGSDIRVTRGAQPADIAARLPPEAQRVFLSLADRVSDARSLSSGASEEASLAARRASDAKRALDEYERDVRHSMSPPVNSHLEIERLRAVMQAAQDEWSRLSGRDAEASAKWQSLDKTYRRLVVYIESLPRDRPIAVHKGAAPSLRKGESVADAIENRRRELRRLAADRHQIQCAPHPSGDVKQRARAQIMALAQRGACDAMGAVENAELIRFNTVTTAASPDGFGNFVQGREVPSLEMIAWLFRDQLIAAVEREIGELSDDKAALDDRQRAERLATIERDRLSVEREEVHFIRLASEQGLALPFRGDCDCRALLGLSDSLPGYVDE